MSNQVEFEKQIAGCREQLDALKARKAELVQDANGLAQEIARLRVLRGDLVFERNVSALQSNALELASAESALSDSALGLAAADRRILETATELANLEAKRREAAFRESDRKVAQLLERQRDLLGALNANRGDGNLRVEIRQVMTEISVAQRASGVLTWEYSALRQPDQITAYINELIAG